MSLGVSNLTKNVALTYGAIRYRKKAFAYYMLAAWLGPSKIYYSKSGKRTKTFCCIGPKPDDVLATNFEHLEHEDVNQKKVSVGLQDRASPLYKKLGHLPA